MSFKYNNLTPFKWCVIQNFPFIEEDFDAITNYQLFCKVVEYLNKTIDSTNILGQKVQEFAEYFENLDVTEEINNKLDKMVEDGTLTNLIEKYLNPYILEQNARINTINSKVDSVATGSPAGVYDTISDLQQANPDHSKIYIVSEDGEWYFWNEETSQWKNGGIYQATGIADNSIKPKMTTFIRNGINQYVIDEIIDNGVHFFQDRNGITNIIGTAISNKRTIISTFTLEKETLLIYRSTGGNPSTYIYNQNDKSVIAQTIPTSIAHLEFTLPAGTYDIETYLIANNEYNIQVGLMLYDKNYDLVIAPATWYKPTKNTILNNDLNGDENYILNLKTVNVIKSATGKNPFVLDLINNKFEVNNGFIISNNFYHGQVPFEHLVYKSSSSLENYEKIIDLNESQTGLNAIFFNVKTGNVHLENYLNWYNQEFVNKYDYTLLIYFWKAGTLELIDYVSISNSIKVITNDTKENPLQDKYLSICGVSIDTYENFIPQGNATYYRNSNLTSVNNTWWKKLIDNTGMQLLVNNSWSGSRATTTNGVPSSGVHRCLSLDDGVHLPDFIIIGTFMFNDWVYSPVGEYKIGDNLPDINVDLTNEEQYAIYENVINNYSGAMATIINRIQRKYPNAKLYAMDAYEYYRNGTNPTYANANKYLSQYNDALYDVCKKFGVEIIKLSECGLTATNSKPYTVDGSVEGSGIGLHPNIKGMDLLYRQCLVNFQKYLI